MKEDMRTMKGNRLSLPKAVTIGEQIVGEGFQGEEQFIPTESKIFLVERLVDAGFKSIWVSSFSHPEVQPQHRDCEEIYRRIPHRDDVTYLVPTPNMRAVERAIKCVENGGAGPNAILTQIGGTEAYNKTLLRITTEEQLKFCEQVLKVGRKAGLKVYAAIVGIWYCLITGNKVPQNVPYELADRLMAMGFDGVSYGEGGDGPEAPSPADVYEFFSRILGKYPDPKMHTLHYHDKLGFGIANFLAAMQAGLTNFDTTLGGMSAHLSTIVDKVPTRGAVDPPFDYYISRGCHGQVPTEDFVAMCEGMGVKTGIDVDKLLGISVWLEKIVGRKLGSSYVKTRIGVTPPPLPRRT
jgi:hydroxymethylglutaryl-CoA lyase